VDPNPETTRPLALRVATPATPTVAETSAAQPVPMMSPPVTTASPAADARQIVAGDFTPPRITKPATPTVAQANAAHVSIVSPPVTTTPAADPCPPTLKSDAQTQSPLAEWLRRRGGSATPRQLQRAHGRRYRTRQDAEAALNSLATIGLGSWSKAIPPGGGHTARVFTLKTDDRQPDDDAEPIVGYMSDAVS
jgi:hypothetical protein